MMWYDITLYDVLWYDIQRYHSVHIDNYTHHWYYFHCFDSTNYEPTASEVTPAAPGGIEQQKSEDWSSPMILVTTIFAVTL